MTQQLFLSLGEAQKLLNLGSRSQMQNLFAYIPHVYFARRGTRFFPTGYINGLAGFLKGRSATLRLVRGFNADSAARDFYEEARGALISALDSRTEHTPTEVAAMLCVGRATVSGWVRSGALPFEERKLQGGQIVAKGPRQRRVMGRQFIQTQTLRDSLKWVVPF